MKLLLRKTFFAFILMAGVIFSASAQSHHHSFICSYYGEPINGPIKTFSSSDDARKVIGGIMDVIGLQSKFQIRSANIPNAAAVISSGQRFILYNPVFINAVNNAAKDKWAAIAILAHEIGHHLNGHTLTGTGSRPMVELEADQFSGFVLRKMGASLEQSQKAMQLIGSNRASLTHPARADRLASIARGWNKADAQMAGKPYTEKVDQSGTYQPSDKVHTTSSRYVLNPKYIKYLVAFSSDPLNEYYITTGNNLVTIRKDQLIVLGKMITTGNRNYPYEIQMGNSKMYLSTGGVVTNRQGNKLGHVRTAPRI